MAVIGGFRSDLSITRKTDGNLGNVSVGVLFSKVAYQRKRWTGKLLSCDLFSFPNRFLILLDDSERVTIVQSLLSRNIPSDSTITFRNIQSGYVILGVLGPNSRQLLQSLTQTSLDDSPFPMNTAKVKYICEYN